jgi:hypothetical protein
MNSSTLVPITRARRRRLAAGATGALVLSTVMIGGGMAPSAQATVAPPIADGVYLDGPGWAAPDSDVGLAFVGDQGCATSKVYAFVQGATSVSLTAIGSGFPNWGVVNEVQLPASVSGDGSIVVSCLAADNSTISASVPITVTGTQPDSTYHTPSMLTLDRPTGSNTVTLSKVGYLTGETVTVTLYDESLDVGGNFAAAVLAPVAVVADGEGAITTQITVPTSWGADLQVLISATTSRRVFDSYGSVSVSTPNLTFVAPATADAGGPLSVSGTDYVAGESVVVALHSAQVPALILGTLIATADGSIAGTVTLPSSVALGSYRVWAGSKTSGYTLQNAPLTVVGPTFADVDPTSPFYTYVQWMSSTGISTGTVQPSGKPLYKPVDAVSRQAMALFLYRLSADTFVPPATQTFADVPPASPFFTAVEWMANRGISTGTVQPSGKPLYKPVGAVSRQAMALFLARYDHIDVSTPPATQSFADVATNGFGAAAIGWMAQTGISTGTAQPSGLPLYKPVDPVSRQAMAAFLYRLAHMLCT